MEDIRIAKVDILIQQKKYAEAERILKDLLATDANNIQYLALLVEVNLQQDKLDVAKSMINNAIGMSPDTPMLFSIKARILLQEEDYKQAESDIRQAIALDPYEADYFAILAHVRLGRKDYEEALTFANKALEIDAMVPGHGPVGTRADLTTLRQYLADLQRLAAEALAGGVQPEQAATIAMPEQYRSWGFYTGFWQNLQLLMERLSQPKG